MIAPWEPVTIEQVIAEERRQAEIRARAERDATASFEKVRPALRRLVKSILDARVPR